MSTGNVLKASIRVLAHNPNANVFSFFAVVVPRNINNGATNNDAQKTFFHTIFRKKKIFPFLL
jgi:hypothetical protein